MANQPILRYEIILSCPSVITGSLKLEEGDKRGQGDTM